MPSSHYMHSPINAVNELPLLTYDATTCVTKNIQTVPSYAEPRGVGGGSGGPGGPRPLSVAPWNFTEWDTTHGTFREVGCECARARAARGGVRACVRETVCARTFMSVFLRSCSSWSSHRLWASHSLKDLLHHLILVSSNKPGQTACQQHPDQL